MENYKEIDSDLKSIFRQGDKEMDISFKVDSGKFNYRVCAMIIDNEKILAMHDEANLKK